ncbi:MAG: reductive dehalogenase [Candidatus Kariarchaeaceae archaeon]|jgi:reductive dehalogenase
MSKTVQKQILIDYKICDPTICEYECIDTCLIFEQGNDQQTLFLENGQPQLDENLCTQPASCDECVQSCPLGALETQILKIEDVELEKAEDLIDLKIWKKSAYVVDRHQYRPFSEQNTIFSRVTKDPNFRDYQTGIYANHEDIVKLNKQGYSRIEMALATAAWTVHDNFSEAFSWENLEITQHGIYDRARDEAMLEQIDVQNPEEMTKILRTAAKAYGASEIGVTKLRKEWIYTKDKDGEKIQIPEHMKNVIVIAVEMDLEALQTSPSMPAAFASGNGYSRMSFILACVAEFIRLLGYDAIPAGNNMGLSIPMAIDAGLGQYGRHGLLINQEFGSNVRLCKIFTNLPLTPAKTVDFGTLAFCTSCKRCANACPSQSISHADRPTFSGPTKSNNPGIFKWYVNVERCYRFWVRNGGDCSTCITVCPLTKAKSRKHSFVKWLIRNFPFMNKLLVKTDQWFGYGRQRDPEEFWDEDKEFIHTR